MTVSLLLLVGVLSIVLLLVAYIISLNYGYKNENIENICNLVMLITLLPALITFAAGILHIMMYAVTWLGKINIRIF